MSAINAMTPYKNQFNTTETGARTGFIFAIYTIGNIVGSFLAGPLTDTWGRRWGMFLGGALIAEPCLAMSKSNRPIAAIIIIGTCIQAPSENIAQFKGGRFLLGVGVALSASKAHSPHSS